jgi:hypothetical protein
MAAKSDDPDAEIFAVANRLSAKVNGGFLTLQSFSVPHILLLSLSPNIAKQTRRWNLKNWNA